MLTVEMHSIKYSVASSHNSSMFLLHLAKCIGSDKGTLQNTPWKCDDTCLFFVLISSDKGTLQKTPLKHDERAHGCYLKIMDAMHIGSDKGTFWRVPWKHDDMDLDVVLIGPTKGALQKTPWKHGERTNCWHSQPMDATCIGSDNGTFWRASWRCDGMGLDAHMHRFWQGYFAKEHWRHDAMGLDVACIGSDKGNLQNIGTTMAWAWTVLISSVLTRLLCKIYLGSMVLECSG